MKAKLSPNLISFVTIRRGDWLMKISVYKTKQVLLVAQNYFANEQIVIKTIVGYNKRVIGHTINVINQNKPSSYLTGNFCDVEIKLPELPHTLTHLTLSVGHNFNGTFDYLPQGLLYFTLIGYHGEPLVNLPNTLKTLIMSASYGETLDMLPDSIETLDIRYYEKKINKLPQNLKFITIKNSYKYKDDLLLLKHDLIINNDFIGF